MRKTFLLLAMSAVGLCSAFAQDEATISSSDFKPAAGDKTLEVQFAPLGGNPFSIGGIRARSFSSSTSALRLNLFVGYNNTSTIEQDGVEDGEEKLVDSERSFQFDIRPGIESHFGGTDKLSPYIGAELQFGMMFTTDIDQEQTGPEEVTETKTINDEGTMTLGLNGLAGVDFYFAKNLYMGAEIGFGFAYVGALKTKVKSDADGFEEPDPSNEGREKTFQLGPNVTTNIRLGWVF